MCVSSVSRHPRLVLEIVFIKGTSFLCVSVSEESHCKRTALRSRQVRIQEANEIH